MDGTKPKISAYAQRNSLRTTVPMDIDSDPDFNPGVYIPDKPKKKTKRATKGRKRARQVEDDENEDSDNVERCRPRKKYRPQEQSSNPLLQYFDDEAEDLGLHTASEPDDEDQSDRGDEEDDHVPNSHDQHNERELEIFQRTWAAVNKPTSPPPLPAASTKDDSSCTESDDDWPTVFSNPIGKAREEESVTESDDSDWAMPAKPTNDASESETESESEDDAPIPVGDSMKPRPGFPLKNDQRDLGPLVLDSEKGIKIPGPINTYLRDYQRDGARFFYRQYKDGKGALLGDDMGLGKTIQVISFLSAIMKKNGIMSDRKRRHNHVSKLQDGESWKKRKQLPPANATWPTCLIIAPSTVARNWERELETWGYFEFGMYTSDSDRKQVLSDFKLGRLDLMVTTFDVARRDIDLLDELPFDCIFVDEAHRLKNLNAKITQAYHQFSCKRRFGLTGTAIQNSYEEMYTILDWTNPGQLGTKKQWKGFIQKPLTLGQSAQASEEEVAKCLMVANILKDKILPQYFLRRTKEIIKDQLPQKIDQVVFCPLSHVQIMAYKRIIESDTVQDLVHKDDPCPCGSGNRRQKCCRPYKAKEVLRHMSILIKLSNHLALILPSKNDTKEQLARNRALSELVFPTGAPMFVEAVMQSRFCGKWDTLNSLLRKWKQDPTNKVLIFTKAVKLIDMLEFLLKQRDYGFLTLDGNTKLSDRMGLIDQFQTDPNIFIFLISTLAGGTGLNLTSANHVVIFDPNWNPAHDLQAMDRAFRFGQTRDVHVYRLLGAGSLEEMIYARQVYKQQQMAIGYDASIQTRYFSGVQGNPQKQGELFGLKNIFKLHEGELSTKRAIEKANSAELDWALANMASTKRKRPVSEEQQKLLDADKSIKEDALQGLGTLLFDDDAVPEGGSTELTEIQKALAAAGVKYTHRNQDILAPSKIGAERAKAMLSKPRRAQSERKSVSRGPKKEKPQPFWPKLRPHHIRKMRNQQQSPLKKTPEQMLKQRQRALICLELIDSPAGFADFSRTFAAETPEVQGNILRRLDDWDAMEGGSD